MVISRTLNSLHIRPISVRMTKIRRTSPSPPLGKYPQFLLWRQVGSAPKRTSINITISIMPMLFFLFCCLTLVFQLNQGCLQRAVNLHLAAGMNANVYGLNLFRQTAVHCSDIQDLLDPADLCLTLPARIESGLHSLLMISPDHPSHHRVTSTAAGHAAVCAR